MVRQGGNSKRNFYGASRSGRNDFQSKFIGATGTEKKKRKGGHKSHRNYCFRFVRSTGCPIHTRHYERRYFRHCSYGSTTDCKSFSF